MNFMTLRPLRRRMTPPCDFAARGKITTPHKNGEERNHEPSPVFWGGVGVFADGGVIGFNASAAPDPSAHVRRGHLPI